MAATIHVQRRVAPSRETLTTVADDGSRVFLHPADVRGPFTRARRLAGVALIAVYVLLPWIPVRGHPALFFDLQNLQLHAFGLTLATQDFWLLFFVITGLGFGLFFLTALLGRVWCGWACPQTVFLDHVFRRIERWIEGDAARRRLLDRAQWTAAKWLRRGSKHALFLLVSLGITHVWLAYFIPLRDEWAMITHTPLAHWGLFLFVLVATGIIYFNFAWFREQLCIIICPYGRLQSALIDEHSLSIGYDAGRGEPRGRPRRGDDAAPAPVGDCIDCYRCVQVCPTGIDIRQGLQLECIGCAACIDACDEVMVRLGRRRGLVRYDSLQGLAGGATRLLRPRVILYTVLLLLGGAVAAFSALRYAPAEASIVRMPGAAFVADDSYVRNQFFLRVTNKRAESAAFTVQVTVDESAGTGPAGALESAGWEGAVTIASGAEERRPLLVAVPRAAYRGPFPFHVEVRVEPGAVVLRRAGEFLGPDLHLAPVHAPPAP